MDGIRDCKRSEMSRDRILVILFSWGEATNMIIYAACINPREIGTRCKNNHMRAQKEGLIWMATSKGDLGSLTSWFISCQRPSPLTQMRECSHDLEGPYMNISESFRGHT